jgi:hypothetical protein
MFEEEIKIFDILQSISTLENIIYQGIAQNGTLTNVELYELTLKNEFLPKHANRVLNNLIKIHKIKEINNSKGYKIDHSSYRDKNIVSRFEVI